MEMLCFANLKHRRLANRFGAEVKEMDYEGVELYLGSSKLVPLIYESN